MPSVHHRLIAALLAALPALPIAAPASGQTLHVSVTADSARSPRQVLPLGAKANLKIAVGNEGKAVSGPIKLTVEPAGLTIMAGQGWRLEAGNAVAEIARLKPGERIERALPLKVERAATDAEARIVRIVARGPGEQTASAEIKLMVADCVGAYRNRLAALRASLTQQVRDAAEAMRKADPALPASRLFAFTNARNAEIRNAERLAASFAARRGGDAEMATEWFRYIIARWISELNAFAGQAYNPGLCANNYYQLAGYRQGLLPITKHIDTIHAAAAAAIAAAREATGAESAEELAALAARVARNGAVDSSGASDSVFGALGAVRATFLRERKASPEEMQQLSLVETAAWLDDADRRGQKLAQTIEQVLSTLASAQKETCICSQ
ncbi:MAG: hypothetical protein IT539_09785 [Bradyrhizobiaceae bacterium]|nr:hypothetical protein [Bradyrhizobiaceae bacterium]